MMVMMLPVMVIVKVIMVVMVMAVLPVVVVWTVAVIVVPALVVIVIEVLPVVVIFAGRYVAGGGNGGDDDDADDADDASCGGGGAASSLTLLRLDAPLPRSAGNEAPIEASVPGAGPGTTESLVILRGHSFIFASFPQYLGYYDQPGFLVSRDGANRAPPWSETIYLK